MQLYPYIFQRKSIRKYDTTPLSQERLGTISNFIENEAKRLDETIYVTTEFLDATQVKGLYGVKAPHYLALFSEAKEGYGTNAGFLLQQVDLYLSSQGIGCCWLGASKTTVAAPQGTQLVIILAFGSPAEPLHRQEVAEFSRKPLAEIAQGDDPRLQAVRLAPSSTNSQPWFLVCEHGNLLIYYKRSGALKGFFMGKLLPIDMGIMLCHLWLASEEEHLPFAFSFETELSAPAPAGYSPFGQVQNNA